MIASKELNLRIDRMEELVRDSLKDFESKVDEQVRDAMQLIDNALRKN
jgi:hypothetical protein